ncbi:hypothetical protein PISL3812_05673 [Talaromyces islandicus]|uniref:Uncharacterized protein n=1 Tax=Talaromyces islandicus TaxID=28573 RepID=A0A0U1LZP9_TALIS|nr:hypothetical protein PISL3812_05673 [Talaromyces islandicus]
MSSHPQLKKSYDQLDDASSWREDTSSLHPEGTLLLPSKDGLEPGFAPVPSLSRGLQVPSRSYRLTSGFEYPAVLSSYDVSEEDWTRFTGEITEEAKMTSQQWRTVIGTGIGTMAIGGMMMGFFGAIPAVIAARRKRAHHETRNLAAAISPDSNSSFSHKLSTWNEDFFKHRGIVIRVDMPYDTDSLEEMDVSSPSSSREGSIVSSRSDSKPQESNRSAREKARNRGRIVIIPLNQGTSVLSQTTTLADESTTVHAVYE